MEYLNQIYNSLKNFNGVLHVLMVVNSTVVFTTRLCEDILCKFVGEKLLLTDSQTNFYFINDEIQKVEETQRGDELCESIDIQLTNEVHIKIFKEVAIMY